MEQHIKVNFYRLMADPISNAPVLVLKPDNEEKLFPIWIGSVEANAISMEIEQIKSPRPMTHDLISDILCCFDGKIEKVVISDLDEDDTTFYAKLFLKQGANIKIIDCRPSDAITLALKYNSNIYVEERLFNSYTLSDQKTGFLNNKDIYNNLFCHCEQEELLDD